MARIRAIGSPIADLAIELLGFFAITYREVFGFPAPPVHDPCAVAWLIDPAVASTRRMRVDIETRGEFTYGRTVCDWHAITGRAPNAEVATDLDADRFWELMIAALANYPAS